MKKPSQDDKPTVPRTTPFSNLPKLYDATSAQSSYLPRPWLQAAPFAPRRSAIEPGDIVARALAVLAESSANGVETKSGFLPLQRRVLRDGTECPLPIRYFDARCVIATFVTDLGRADEVLEGANLTAVPRPDGKAVALLGWFQYRDSDLGPYDEVGLSISSTAPGDAVPAGYVANLPVSTALANRVGREIWGYNKFVAAIDFKHELHKFSTSLRDPENAIIGTLEGGCGHWVQAPPTDLPTFSFLDGAALRTLIQVLTPFQVGGGENFVLRIGPSKHPMADNLRTLGLDLASPLSVQYADPFQALLFPGRSLGTGR